jgi:hypothetical protein
MCHWCDGIPGVAKETSLEIQELRSHDIFEDFFMSKTSEAYARAIDCLRDSATPDGFIASTTERDNYRRIWARDGCVMGLAGLVSGDEALEATCRRTLLTLAGHQGPHGEIPSNVDPATERVSYGGTAGRVDADLWFVVVCGQYWRRTGDETFLQSVASAVDKVQFLLGAWEYNARGLLYVPLTGDWADEYIHNGYVLFDQLLYLQSLRELAVIHQACRGTCDNELRDKTERLEALIRDNYWVADASGLPDDVYHEVLFKNACRVEGRSRERYFLPFFSPVGYGYRFDAMANIFASLLGVATSEHSAIIDKYIADEVIQEEVMVLPAFHPVITPKDEDWRELQMTFSYEFKNRPYEYHNGGLWPMVTGFYTADLATRGKTELAERYLEGLSRAHALSMDGQDWAFPEYLHGQKHTPSGTPRLGWSAAAQVIAHNALKGHPVFSYASE